MKLKFGLISFIFAVFAAFAPQTALSAAGERFITDHGEVRLISAVNSADDAEALSLGLHFTMKPGWKIYWRSPGDAGFPPQPRWAGSSNVKSVDISWPAPTRFSVLGLETLGYKKEVVLPLRLVPARPGEEIDIRATVPYLTCEEICVPYEAKLTLRLPAGPGSDAAEAALISKFAKRVPRQGPGNGMSILLAELDGGAKKPVLRIVSRADQPFASPDLLIEGPPGYAFGKPARQAGDDPHTLVMSAVVHAPQAKARNTPDGLSGQQVRLTVIDGDRAIEQGLTVKNAVMAAPSPPAASVGWDVLLGILGLALIGGFILNLMPCVLPVLSLKLLSVVSHGGADRADVRKGFLATSAGIVASFLVLATGAVLLKATGNAAGWGIQFQHPLFLSALAAIVTLFAANLFGLFEIRLPGAIADAAAGAGDGQSLPGHFLTGAFATLLATPCSAPFLGTAVGFALARGAFEIYAIFTALGIGLALPYLLVSVFPGLATRMPKPGPWMVNLRRILGLALAATAVWLLSVLATQAGQAAMYATAIMLVLVFVTLILFRRRETAAVALALVLAVGASAAAPIFAVEGRGVAASGAVAWQKFDPGAIAGHVRAGRTVFVDVTADWCVTCKVNKALVLDTDAVSARLNGKDVIAMQADWTRPDPVITAFLARYNRYGIPFNIVFGPSAPDGRPLPELLTSGVVLGAIDTVRVAGK